MVMFMPLLLEPVVLAPTHPVYGEAEADRGEW